MYMIGLLLIFAGGVLELRSLYSFFEFDANGDPPLMAIFFQVVGIPVTLLGTLLTFGGAHRYTGKLLFFPVVGPGTILFAGFAVGAWWGRLAQKDPNIWLAILPMALATVAAIAAALGIGIRMRRRVNREALSVLLVSGRIVPAVIAYIPEIEPNSRGLIGPVTVKFTDNSGVNRWVQKTGQWRRADLPKTGDTATVLFDPQDPSNVERIWIGPPGAATVADFGLWHS